MSTGQLRWKVDVYNRGITATTGTVAWTWNTSQLASAPHVGGYLVRPTEGRSESQPWSFTVLDKSSAYTVTLGTTNARMHQLGRLVRIRRSTGSTASTAYKTQMVGRIADLFLEPDITSYRVNVTDERWVERQLQAFTTINEDLSFIPGGLVQNAPAGMVTRQGGGFRWIVRQITGNLVLLEYVDSATPITVYDRPVLDYMTRDFKTRPTISYPIASPGSLTVGFFNFMRWKNAATGTNYEIAGFGALKVHAGGGGIYAFPKFPMEGISPQFSDVISPYIWLVWTAGAPTKGQIVTGWVHMSGATPDPVAPKFVGGTNGLHPGKLARQIYTNTYGDSTASTAARVRISTAGFDTWEADPSYGKAWFRITAPVNMSEFLEARVFAPYGMVPVPDSSGKITPVSILLPTTAQLPAALSTQMHQFNSGNLVGHPTWENPNREAVTALTLTHEYYASFQLPVRVEGVIFGTAGYASADRMWASTGTYRETADTVATLGRRELTFKYGMVSPDLPFLWSSQTGNIPAPTGSVLSRVAKSVFARFGDGPVYSGVQCLNAIDTSTKGKLTVGKYAVMNLGTMPSAGGVRGQGRFVQVIERSDPVGIPTFRVLDLGLNSAALSAPTVAVAVSSQSSRHAIKATVASMTAGANYELRIAPSSTGGSAPAAGSSQWRIGALGSTGTLVTHIHNLASKTRWHAQVRQLKPLRVISKWSTAAANAVTATIPNITGPSFSTAGQGAGRVLAKWTNGSSLYGVQIHVNDTTALFTVGTTNMVAMTGPQTTQYQITDITPANGIRVSLRPFDAYGGVGVGDSASYKPGSTAKVVAPSMRGISIVQGNP